ncbi:MAG: glycosyltransferase family 4 protein [Candidatus Omnitrophota bacterium]
MKIFASLMPSKLLLSPKSASGQEKIYGAWVATKDFYRALLQHGTFNEYHFFTEPEGIVQLKTNLLQLNVGLDRVKIIVLDDMRRYLRDIQYTLFFTSSPNLSELAHLRLRFSKRLFPICGLTHAISYVFMLRSVFFANMVAEVYPFDSIICPSRAVFTAAQNLSRLVSRSFKKNRGWKLAYNGRFDRLPLGVDAGEFSNIDRNNARKSLGLERNQIIILYFGRLSSFDKADLCLLLAAFKEIALKKNNVSLLVAGVETEQGYGLKLKNIAREMGITRKVKFIFRNCLKEKHLIYAASDIFVSPTDNIQETFGMTIIEAMAAGLPVVASQWNGYKDLVVHNKTGFLVPTYWTKLNSDLMFLNGILGRWQKEHLYFAQSVALDTDKFKDYLLRLINNPALRKKMGGEGRRRVLAEFDWKKVIPQYEKLWLKLYGLSKRYKTGRQREPVFMPDYFYAFKHYPSRILDGKTRIGITEKGLSFLNSKKLPCDIEGQLTGVIYIRIIFAVLSYFCRNDYGRISEVERYASGFIGRSLSTAISRHHIMWLLKKGMIRVTS